MHKRLLEVVEGIPLPLTEGACAPLVTKQHYLARILDPWLPVDSCVRAVNQPALWPETCGLSGVKPSHTRLSAALGLYVTHRGGDDVTARPAASLFCWSSGSGPQSRAAPREAGKVLWNAGGGRSGTEGGAVLRPPAMVAHLGVAGVLGERYDQLPFPEREAQGFGRRLGEQPRNKEGRKKMLFPSFSQHLAGAGQGACLKDSRCLVPAMCLSVWTLTSGWFGQKKE